MLALIRLLLTGADWSELTLFSFFLQSKVDQSPESTFKLKATFMAFPIFVSIRNVGRPLKEISVIQQFFLSFRQSCKYVSFRPAGKNIKELVGHSQISSVTSRGEKRTAQNKTPS